MKYTGLNILRPAMCLFVAMCFAAGAVGQPIAVPERAAEEDAPTLLTDEQINLIKIYEVRLDSQPRITIEQEVLEEFLREFAADERIPKGKAAQREFLRAEGYQQLGFFFDLRAREYYGKATMRGEPEAMRTWHRTGHRDYIQEYFRPLFGVGQVEELYLFDRGRDQDRVSYTNFYILTQISLGGVPMIDRDKPEESLILQWGLPRADAKFPAPDVPNWQPHFRNVEDPRFVRMVEMIKTFIVANRNSDYGITYRVPNYRRPAGDE